MQMKYIQQKKLRLKRFTDVVFSAALLALFSPVFIVTMLAIMIENMLRGKLASIFYVEARISMGKSFKLIKFNIFKPEVISMYRKQNIFIHTKELEKKRLLTYVGFLLKQIYFDELPQLINVLKNNMSLVGPRPLNLEVYARRKKEGWATVEVLKGGITGGFQSFKNVEHKTAQQLEEKYLQEIRKRSPLGILLLDLSIMLRTIKVILRAEGV